MARKGRQIEETDPDRIYVENIRSFFNFPHAVARGLCNLAVREGFFERRVGFLCPNPECGRLIVSAQSPDELSEAIVCETCELDGADEHQFPRAALTTIVFYRLIDP